MSAETKIWLLLLALFFLAISLGIVSQGGSVLLTGDEIPGGHAAIC